MISLNWIFIGSFSGKWLVIVSDLCLRNGFTSSSACSHRYLPQKDVYFTIVGSFSPICEGKQDVLAPIWHDTQRCNLHMSLVKKKHVRVIIRGTVASNIDIINYMIPIKYSDTDPKTTVNLLEVNANDTIPRLTILIAFSWIFICPLQSQKGKKQQKLHVNDF